MKMIARLLVLAFLLGPALPIYVQAADTAIDGLSAITLSKGAETFPCNQSSVSMKCTISQFTNEYWPETYGALADGSTNDAAAIQSAIDAASAAGGGVVKFKRAVYLTTSTITLKSGVTLEGVIGNDTNGNSSTISNGTGTVFTISATTQKVQFYRMRVNASAGHIFDFAAQSMSEFSTVDCFFNNNEAATTHRIITMTPTAGKYFIQASFVRTRFYAQDGKTVEMVLIKNETVNNIYFTDCRYDNNAEAIAQAYDVTIESTAAAAFAEAIRVTNTFHERSRGGMYNLVSVRNVVLDTVNLYDQAAVPDNDLVKISKSAGSVASANVTLINCLIKRNHATVADVYIDGTVSGQGRVVLIGGTLGRVKGSSTATWDGGFSNQGANVSNWEVATRIDANDGNLQAVGLGTKITVYNSTPAERAGLTPGATGTMGVLKLFDATAGNMKYCKVVSGTIDCTATAEP